MKTILGVIIWCEKLIAPVFSKLPPLPIKSRRVIVTYLPYVILFIGLASLFQSALSIMFKISRLLFTAPELLTLDVVYATLTNLIIGTILVYSFHLLKNKKQIGWRYILGVSLFTGILNLFVNQFGLLQSGLFLYILFQIKENYHS